MREIIALVELGKNYDETLKRNKLEGEEYFQLKIQKDKSFKKARKRLIDKAEKGLVSKGDLNRIESILKS